MPSGPLYSHLFIIDDDIEDQEIFIEAVKEVSDDIHCSSSTSGEEALHYLEHEAKKLPDLIFLDLNMPKLNGKQVLKEIKKRPSLKSIPVIMYSTSFAPRDIDEVKQIGASHHLLKPSRFNDLCAALSQILNQHWKAI
ncbi:MAG TPA: response regulator [Chryseosolibacter sp.]